MAVPVSIRTKNPGAMWPGPVATRFGSTQHEDLKDGNKAAIFPTFEQGAAAQFYLWSHNYSGMTLGDAIFKWSGHNSSKEYAGFLEAHVPHLDKNTKVSVAFLASPDGLAFVKAQAAWEAGQTYPMTDDQWHKAQMIAFGDVAAPIAPAAPTSAPSPASPPPAAPAPAPAPGGLFASILSFILSAFKRT